MLVLNFGSSLIGLDHRVLVSTGLWDLMNLCCGWALEMSTAGWLSRRFTKGIAVGVLLRS